MGAVISIRKSKKVACRGYLARNLKSPEPRAIKMNHEHKPIHGSIYIRNESRDCILNTNQGFIDNKSRGMIYG